MPRAAELELGGEASDARHARRFIAATLATWGLTRLEDTATLLVSELVGNAALHARTSVTVRACWDGGTLRLEVSDGSQRAPTPRQYGLDATTGRGLGLVVALAARWGVDPVPEGKTVWAEIDVPGGLATTPGPAGATAVPEP